jgi:endonuclease/exonuclease/phosphatase (EEP) superfamily protein YafD
MTSRRRVLNNLATVMSIPVVIVALGSLVAPWHWLGDLCVHWSVHVAIFSVVPMVLWRRQPALGITMMVLCGILLMPGISAAWQPRAEAIQATDGRVHVASANLHKDNPQRAGDIAAIRLCQADVLVLIEIDTGDEESLRDDPRWPEQRWEHGGDGSHRGFGVALLSRFPITTFQSHNVDSDVLLEAVIASNAGPLRVLAVHPQSPGGAESTARRDRQLAMICRLAIAEQSPVVVLGDFNCTALSPAWSSTIGAVNLLRAPGHSPATWPWFLGPFGISIDHIIARNARLSAVVAQGVDGSDHRMVSATIGL